MKYVLLFVSLFITGVVHAQVPAKDSLAGKWVCHETILAKEVKSTEVPDPIKQLMAAFRSSVFEFNKNGLFQLRFPANAPALAKELAFLNNQKWTIDATNSFIDIGAPKENLMQIIVKQKNGETFFLLSDTPLLLKMVKEK